MRIQPRQHLLEILTAAAKAAIQHSPGKGRMWEWGGRDGANSISDAEQLLCFLLPTAEVDGFGVHSPDDTNAEVRKALASLGDASTIPRLLTAQLIDYMRRYTAEDGSPTFAGETYFLSRDEDGQVTPEQLSFDVVESFAASITLTLTTLTLVRRYRPNEPRRDIRDQLDELEQMASKRLTAAMVGLLRSFSVNVIKADSAEGRELLRTVNQTMLPDSVVQEKLVPELRNALAEVRAGLRRVTLGSGQVKDEESALSESDTLLELGWSWGVIKGAEEIRIVYEEQYDSPSIGAQRDGYGHDAPYLYFTVVALDCMAELFSERTRRDGLLDDLQQRLADALRIRWDLTQRYWAIIASFGEARWPLEDIPWRATDGQESDYFTLMVSSIAARRISERSDNLSADLTKLVSVLTELANRSRITRRPLENDPAITLHAPGLELTLEQSEERGGPVLKWIATDFAPLLLKRAIRTARLVDEIELKDRILDVADQVWAHLRLRRLKDGPGRELWDQPAGALPVIKHRFDNVSWHHTIRVVETMVLAADLVGNPPLRSPAQVQIAQDLLSEASHLFDQELLAVDSAVVGETDEERRLRGRRQTVQDKLERAREILDDRPGSAAALLYDVLAELDRLASIRRKVAGS